MAKLTSIQNSGTNNFLNPLKSANKITSVALTPGVLGHYSATAGVAPAFGPYAVNAQASPNMTVAVAAGDLVVTATPAGDVAQNFIINLDSTENVTIASNSSGLTKTDFIYLQLDATKLTNPAVTGLDAASLITQRSTTASADSNGTPINSLLLAEVSVANAAVSISNSNIIDRRVRAGFPSDGWIPTTDSWTYASATTITVPTGAAGKYSVGDKVRLFQAGSIKYFYIVAVADTTLTITGGSDYTLTNTTISQPSYSHKSTPVGFPQWFNFAVTYTGFSANPTTIIARFQIAGRLCSYSNDNGAAGTSNATTLTATLPVAPSSSSASIRTTARAVDNGVTLTTPALVQFASGSTVNIYKDYSGAAWTASGSKSANFLIHYEI